MSFYSCKKFCRKLPAIGFAEHSRASRTRRSHYVRRETVSITEIDLTGCAFSKRARAFLSHIRAHSDDALKARILQRIAEITATPVMPLRNKFDVGMAVLMERIPSDRVNV